MLTAIFIYIKRCKILHIPGPWYSVFISGAPTIFDLNLVESYSKTFKDGVNVVRVGYSRIAVRDPEIANEVLTRFPKLKAFELIKFFHNANNIVSVSDAKTHRNLRSLVQPAFNMSYIDDMKRCCTGIISELSGETDMSQVMESITTTLLGEVGFGSSLKDI